jgi:hypothetical protein
MVTVLPTASWRGGRGLGYARAMKSVLRAATVVALALSLVATTGCGGDAKRNNKYVDAVNKAQNSFAATFDRLQGEITQSSTPSQDRATLTRFQGAIDKVVADLRAVSAPGKVTSLHQRLIAEIASYGDEIQKAKKAFSSKDPAKILSAQSRLVTAVTQVSSQINGTIDAINKKLHG